MNNLKKVSVLVPCRNEEKYIGKCIESIINNGYPIELLEVLIVDGLSTDKTVAVVEEYADKYPFCVKLIINEKAVIPAALNLGISCASGDIIMLMSSHATYEHGYINKCMYYMELYGADNVGGIWNILPRENTLMGNSIVSALSNRFGVGNAYYRIGTSKEPRWVDAVAFGCLKKEMFNKIGLFNEKLERSEDIDFNSKLRKYGGKILLVPEIACNYYARSDIKSFIKHNFLNGIWTLYPIKIIGRVPVSARHLVPLTFVSSLIVFGCLSIFNFLFLKFFLAIIFMYLATNLYYSARVALRKKNIAYAFIMPGIFSLLHISYGLGSLWGLMKVFMLK